MTFRHTKKWYFWAKWITKIIGLLLCILPWIVATYIKFPDMVTENTTSTISMPFVLCGLITITSVLQIFIKIFENNKLFVVSIILAVITALFIGVSFMEKETIKGFAVISGSATIGTMLAVMCFKLALFWDDLYKHCGEVYING